MVVVFGLLLVAEPLPAAPPGEGPQKKRRVEGEKLNVVKITLTKEGRVLYRGRQLGLEGVQPLLKPLLAKNKELSCIIHADKDTKVVRIMEVMDEVILAGVQKSRLTVATK